MKEPIEGQRHCHSPSIALLFTGIDIGWWLLSQSEPRFVADEFQPRVVSRAFILRHAGNFGGRRIGTSVGL